MIILSEEDFVKVLLIQMICHKASIILQNWYFYTIKIMKKTIMTTTD